MKNSANSDPKSKLSNAKQKPSNPTEFPKPGTKPKRIICKPRPEHNLEPKPSYVELQFEITALKEENLKLCRQIAKLKAENTTLKSQITLLTEDYAQYRHDNPPLSYHDASEKLKKLEEEENRLMAELGEEKKDGTQQ